MPSLETIKNWVTSEYNEYISVYVNQNDNVVRMTNGSAAHYVDIHPDDDTFTLTGERYGDVIDASCDATKHALLETLARTI